MNYLTATLHTLLAGLTEKAQEREELPYEVRPQPLAGKNAAQPAPPSIGTPGPERTQQKKGAQTQRPLERSFGEG